MAEKEARKMSSIELIKAAKDFSFEQKLNVVQSVVQMIPREQQRPWNMTKAKWERYQREKANIKSDDLVKSASTTQDHTTECSSQLLDPNQTADTTSQGTEPTPEKEELDLMPPPLLDPYEQSMRYYEKNLILNRFQHMTAQLVLHRPEDALQHMIDWCKEMQLKSQAEATKVKMLYQGKTEDSDDDDPEPRPSSADVKKHRDSDSFTTFGNRQLEVVKPGGSAAASKRSEDDRIEEGQGDQVTANDGTASIREQDSKPDGETLPIREADERGVTVDDGELSVSDTVSALSSRSDPDSQT